MASPEPAPGTSSASNARHGPGAVPALADELTGSLPCVRCRYDLRGLSIRALCPECATPVRATLLAVVDPKASELQPIFHPRITAAGLVLWSSSALLAVAGAWALWIIESLPTSQADEYVAEIKWTILLLAAISGLGAAVSLVNPHPGIKRSGRIAATSAVLAYLPLCLVLWQLLVVRWYAGWTGGLGPWAATSEARSTLGLLVQVLIILIVMGLRSNARLLAARSVLMRQGRVDRQTMLALAAVLAVSMTGNLVSLLSGHIQPADTLLLGGQALVLTGSALFTLGLIGATIDCWRIRRVVVQPPLSLESLFEEPATKRSEKHAP